MQAGRTGNYQVEKEKAVSADVPNWEQNAKDAEQILCDGGDLFRECYEELKKLGSDVLAEKVQAFCYRAYRCMTTGTKWEELSDENSEVIP